MNNYIQGGPRKYKPIIYYVFLNKFNNRNLNLNMGKLSK